MSDRVQIPRELPPFKLESNTPGPAWFTCTDGTVLLRCACGVILGEPRKHSIDADGTVNASLICNQVSLGRQPCGWHVFGRLIDWPGGAMPAGSAKVLKEGE